MIYLNNATTSMLKPEGVKQWQRAKDCYGCSDYERTIQSVKEKLAKILGVKDSNRILLTQSGSQAIELTLMQFICSGDHIITTDWEHDSTKRIFKDLSHKGVEISIIETVGCGNLNIKSIETLIKPNTKAIVVCHGNPITGNVVDMERITAIARKHRLMVISDGCQTVGGIEVNLAGLSVDAYCFTAHKRLMGPYGIGGVILKEGYDFSEDIKKTLPKINGNLLKGFELALDFALEKGNYSMYIFPHRLGKRFFEAVQSMDRVKVFGDFGTSVRLPNVCIKVEGFTANEVVMHMRKSGIVVKNVGYDERVCFSFGYYNTRMDVNDTIWALMNLLEIYDMYLLA